MLADSVAGDNDLSTCQPVPSMEGGVSISCVTRSADTVVTLVSLRGDRIRQVTRVWSAHGQQAEAYALRERLLQQTYGRGEPTCLAANTPPGRQWQASGYYLILHPIKSSDSLYLTYILGQPKYRPGCPYR
jgi:hypothetical protein